MEKLRRLHGMRDLLEDSWRPHRAAENLIREALSLYGYQSLETPLLEPTELFLRKSGGELAARMYTFTDPGGNRVSLRPEFTSSIVRHYLTEGSSRPLPLRVQYAGPVFRYEGSGDTQRQFTQVGAELLGSSDPLADAEILSLSCLALSGLGLKGHVLQVGDVGVLHQLLESLGLSERATLFILSNLAELKSGEAGLARVHERAKQLHLLGAESGPSYLSTAINHMEQEDARELLSGLLEWSEVGSMGQRQPSEVVDRLLSKVRGSDDPAKLERGVELAYKLVALKGDPETCLRQVKNVIRSCRLEPSLLDRFESIVSLLDSEELQHTKVTLDFGLTRGLAYYTGIVFEVKHPGVEAPLAGGGRYDTLARALGSPSSVPALGFAYTLEHVLEALSSEGATPIHPAQSPGPVLVYPVGTGSYSNAIQVARELRSKGIPVEMEVYGRTIEDALEGARSKGLVEVIEVDSKGNTTKHPVQQSDGPAAKEGR